MTHHLIGIDLGTSSVRAGVYGGDGSRLSIAARSYPIDHPAPDRAEQDPEAWWRATCEAVAEALAKAGISGGQVTGIALDGQMHGGAMLDGNGDPVCPAVIWADNRSAGILDELTELIGTTVLETAVMNRMFPGTFAATLHWMRRNDTAVWKRIRHILPTKDYIRYRMCGLYHTDPSDASATLLFDQVKRDWSDEVLKRLDLPLEFMPYVVNSDEQVGETEGMEDAAGIPDGVPVVIGGADQACASLGNGLLDEGTVFIAIGTGGQVVTPLEQPRNTPDLALNTFCHLPENRWYLMGATLAAGLGLKWFRDTFCPGTEFGALDREASATPPASGPVFHPYLPGKRSPDLNPSASGVFHGLRLHHTRGHLVRSVMEGVAFDLRENLDAMLETGVRAERIIASGGGAASDVWMRILADVLRRPVEVSTRTEQACFGAALVAGIGTGAYRDYHEAASFVPRPGTTVEPRPGNAEVYEACYHRYLDLYGLHGKA